MLGTAGLITPCIKPGPAQFAQILHMHHLRGGDPHHPRFPPTWGASLPPSCSTLASLGSDQACRSNAAILAPHVTDWRAWPERQRRDLQLADSSAPLPRSSPTQSKAAPSSRAEIGRGVPKLRSLIGSDEGSAPPHPKGPPPASLACPLPAICQPGRLLANLKGTWGCSGAGLLLRAAFSGRLA